MKHRFLVFCSMALSCQLIAKNESIENFASSFDDMRAVCESYEANRALLAESYPGASIKFDSITGTITVAFNNDMGTSDTVKELTFLNIGGSITSSNQPKNGASGCVISAEGTVISAPVHFFVEDSAYAKNVPIQCFILSELQMPHFFSNFPPQPEPLNFHGFPESNLYLIVQIKNSGPRPSYGILHFPFFHKSFSVAVDLSSEMSDFSTYVVPLGMRDQKDFEDTNDVQELLNGLVWDELYVGPTAEEGQEWNADLYRAWNEGKTVFKMDDVSEIESRFFSIYRSPI